MSRVFNATVTDSSDWTNATDSITETAIGLSMPNVTINMIQASQATGVGVWRIIDSVTGFVHRIGHTNKTGYTDPADCMINPITITPPMLFQLYTLADDATANEANVLSIVTSNRGRDVFVTLNSPDGVLTETKSLLSNLGVGNLLFGATISNVTVSGEAGMFLSEIVFKDSSNGVIYTGFGSVRLPTAGGKSALTNGAYNVSIGLEKGYTMLLKTTTA